MWNVCQMILHCVLKLWYFPVMKMNLKRGLFCKEMVFLCVIWSFDDMGLGEQVTLSDKKSKGGT